MFKNPFSFNGRIRRLEFGLSQILYLVIYLPMYYITFLAYPSAVTMVPFVLLFIFLYWFIIAQGAKRCHDRGNSVWWQLIPFYGFWMLFAPGDIGDNEYGPNPKVFYYDFGAYEIGDNRSSPAPIDDVDDEGIIKTEK